MSTDLALVLAAVALAFGWALAMASNARVAAVIGAVYLIMSLALLAAILRLEGVL